MIDPNDAAQGGMAPESVSREAFIQSMRMVASSVCVVTTDGAAGRHGATVSAFCSVSADPPTVLVCLKADSRIARLVKANAALAVNLLSTAQVDKAVRFAGGDDAALKAVQQREDETCDRFDGVDLDLSCGQPVLTGAMGFTCRVNKIETAGSHAVVIADVVAVQPKDHAPLIYLDGGFQCASALHEAD